LSSSSVCVCVFEVMRGEILKKKKKREQSSLLL
jgi:hypothetical protein